ncbi:G-protein coupled receptor 171 [Osmerus mordax]|uniref:G-protein coupled receptor 171 n=1 Tax=Osmerus mordax TaxID=8014 RepID=UPI003510601A
MSSPPNTTSYLTADPKRCVVNDQMEPFIVLYILIFLVSLAGNAMSLWAFTCGSCFHGSKECTNVYLTNLLASDIILTLALPFKIAKDLGVASWEMMVFHCQVSAVLIYISLYASIFFLAFISVDRYLQVFGSARVLRVRHVGFARLMSAVVWMLVLVVMVPNMLLPIHSVAEERLLSCSALKKGVGLHWHAFSIFLSMALFLNASAAVLISSGLILQRLLGSRHNPDDRDSACQATVYIAVVTVAYVVSFVPYHVVRTPYTLNQAQVLEQDCPTRRHLFLAKESTWLLALLHVCFDPALYYFFSQSFRERIGRVFDRRTRASVSITEPAAVILQSLTATD